MNKLLKISGREYITRVRSKLFIIGTILGPIFIVGIGAIPALVMHIPSERQRTIAVVDLTGNLFGPLRQALDDTVKGGKPRFQLVQTRIHGSLESTRRMLNEELERRTIHAYIVIPEDVYSGEVPGYFANTLGKPEVRILNDAINRIVVTKRLRNAGFDAKKVRGLMKEVEMRTVKVQDGKEREGGFLSDNIVTFVFVMILYGTIFVHSTSLMQSVIEDKNARVIEILLSSVTPAQLMGGKILGVGAVGLTQNLIWLLFGAGGAFWLRASFTDLPFPVFSFKLLFFFFIFLILGFILFASLYVGVGSLCNSNQDAQPLALPMTLILMVPMMLMGVVAQHPDSGLSIALSLIPFFSPMVMFMRINLLHPPAYQIAISLLFLLVTIFLMIRFTAKVFRTGILFYGKRPSFSEIFRWLRKV